MEKGWLAAVLAAALLVSGCDRVEKAKTTVLGWMGKTSLQSEEQQTKLSEGQYQVSGKIKEIRGNEMTLELGELQGNRQGMGGLRENGKAQGSGEEEADSSKEMRDLPDMRGQGGPTAGGMQKGRQPDSGGSASTRKRSSGLGTQSVSFEKNGETKTYLIPVKTPVYASGNMSTKLSFSQLEEGAIVTATFQKEDGRDDYFISIQVVG